MEKVLALLAAVLMMFGFATVGLTADQNTTTGTTSHETTTTTHETMTGTTGHEAGMEHQLMSYSGVISSVDQNGQMIVVKGKDGDKTFDVSKAMMKGIPETHHAVVVKYMSSNGKLVASSITPVSQKASNDLKKLYDKYM